MKGEATILVIFGISGDLANRYFLPSMESLAKDKALPLKFRIVGISRNKEIKKEDILNKNSKKENLAPYLEIFNMDTGKIGEYDNLNKYLKELEQNLGGEAQILFYLSVPTDASREIIEHIGESELIKNKRVKLLLEKPFGSDLESAKDLIEHIQKYFKEEQIYRIDHYLAKEGAKNVITERQNFFKDKWNKDFIKW